MRRQYLFVLLATLGCRAESEAWPTPAEDESCPLPNRIVGERCVAPGVQDDGCPAGTLGLQDGSCQPAGVSPEFCATGFVHDGDAACEPTLPAAPCPEGQLAIPGESACHAVMGCGAGKWGDIPIDGTTVHVDASYAGGGSDGSSQYPFITLGDGVTAAMDGALIAVAAGSYHEDVVVQKRVRLWGACPERVELIGTGAELAALAFRPGSSGSEVRGVAIRGNSAGIEVSGSEDVLIEHVWVHDSLGRGVDVEGTLGPTSATLSRSLVEQTHELGVFVYGAEATLEGVVVRDTMSRVTDQLGGRGVNIQTDPMTGARATVLLKSSLVERNREIGVYAYGSQTTVEGVVVRDTFPRESDQLGGRGINIQDAPNTSAAMTAVVRSSLIEHNREIGVFVAGVQATIEGVVVRDTLPQAIDEEAGRGINIQLDPNTRAPSTALVRSSLVTQNREVAVIVIGSTATVEGVLVRDTLPQESDQSFGRGLSIERDPATNAPATVLIKGSRVERSHDVGINIVGSEVNLDALVVRATDVRASDGLLGDGVAIASRASQRGSPLIASALVTHSHIEDSVRAGLGSFGAHVALTGSALICNAFDLDGEEFLGLPYTFEDLGGNGCGCPKPNGSCAARSTGLAPPEPLAESQ